MTSQYGSGVASLFASAARGVQIVEVPDPNEQVIICCTECGSKNTEPVDHEFDIFICLDCGKTFIRTFGGSNA